ncbi:organomercurial lyase [Halosimplex salinum]|uniref:organomercurial lyase n=1 Tax=Halosimplex salinum TaxID=1710538 RepID=UPI000F49624D|nr:organomercurial lyase [Halosimplex salinum]
MWTEVDGSDSIGPKLSLADVVLPPAVGDGFAGLYGSAERPETAAEWVADMRGAIEREYDRTPTVDDLCTVEDGDHAFVGADGAQTYICVLDPLAYPFLTGETGTVRSTTPVRGTEVEFEVRADGVGVSHDDAVVSIGISEGVDGDEVSIERVYQEVCGFVQTFEDDAEYEEWAAEADGATTAVPAREGVAIARELADALFEEGAQRPGGGCSPDGGCC